MFYDPTCVKNIECWLVHDVWTAIAGVAILSGIDPTSGWIHDENSEIKPLFADPWAFNSSHHELADLHGSISRIWLSGQRAGIHDSNDYACYPPSYFIKWALSKRIDLPWLGWAREQGLVNLDDHNVLAVQGNSTCERINKIGTATGDQEPASLQGIVKDCLDHAEKAKAGNQESVRWIKGRLRGDMDNNLPVNPVLLHVAIESFLNENVQLPDFIDPSNERYSSKLAATIRAWQAVTDTRGKHPRQAIRGWLTEHATELGLTDKDGRPSTKAIDECSTVANWRPTGGAPKTPGNNPSTH